MRREITAELKIDQANFNFSERNIIAIYRDLVEGGKPQLLFFLKVNQTAKEIESNFMKVTKKTNRRILQSKMLADGEQLIFVDKSKLESMYIAPDKVKIENTFYPTMPSASACIVLLIEYLKKTKSLE